MRAVAHLRLLFVAACASMTACVDLPDITEVQDLRVLAVQADKPGFLVNLDDPSSTPVADFTATLTALVIDPRGQGAEVTFSAVGCPDLLDAITSATGQAPKPCGPGTLGYTALTPAAPSPATPVSAQDPAANAAASIEYHPSFAPYGLAPSEVALLFTPQLDASPQIAQAIEYNRQFGIDAIVNLTFTLGAEQASAVKRLIYWPDLRATFPNEVPNSNPAIDRLEFYSGRDDTTGDPTGLWTTIPMVSIAAKDKLYALPILAPGAVETYPLTARDVFSGVTSTKEVQELLVFDYYTTAGTFSPPRRENAAPIFSPPGTPIHLDSQLNLPSLPERNDLAPTGLTEVWVVVHDERGGVGWTHASVMIAP